MEMNKKRMRIKQLVEESGVPRTTIHYYLRNGVLHPPHKSGRTMAYYDRSHLDRLALIQKIKGDNRLPIAYVKQKVEEALKEGAHQPYVSNIVETQDENLYENPKRRQIVAAAIRVFSEKGYHQTKIQDITSAVGISTGTFYIYFENKQELFIDVVDDVIRQIIAGGVEDIKKEKDPFTRLRVRGRVFYENYSKYNEILHQLRAEMAGRNQWPAERIKKIYQDLSKPVIRDVRKAMAAHKARDVDPELLAYALIGIIEIMSLRTTLDSKYSFDDIINFIEDFTQHGVEMK